MIFDPTKPCTTRDGREVRLFAERMKDGRLAGTLTRTNGDEVVSTWYPGGNYYENSDSNFDLFNIPVKRTVWVNFYRDWCCFYYDSRKEADMATRYQARSACVKVEFEEGEGL